MIVLAPFDSQTGILLVGHGSREPDGNQPLPELCRGVETQLGITPVQPSYLELTRPTIDEGLGVLYRRGVERVVIVPLQLTAGRHVRYDIPCEVGKSLAKMSNMSVCFTDHLGPHPVLSDIADSRLHEALSNYGPASGPIEHILVARGSRDPLVRGGILSLGESRQASSGGSRCTPCFLAMAEPTFEDVLRMVVSREPARVVVQPHLLYPGRLLNRIKSTVEQMSVQHPHIEWVVVNALGPDARLIDAVIDLAVEACEKDFHRQIGPTRPVDELV